MAKKKQPDFSKNQIKPGRTLHRKKNVTNTSFKSKKINLTKKKNSSQKSDLSMTECLNFINSPHSSRKRQALNHIKSVVINQRESFLPYMAEVFESVAKLVIEKVEFVRTIAVEILSRIFECSDPEIIMKISNFIPLLIRILSCGMTNTVFRTKLDTLRLLTSILISQPYLICKSRVILQNFYFMITGTPRKSSHLQSKSLLPSMYDNRISSEEYRIKVLECLQLFLKEMIRSFEIDNVEEENEEQELYWNCEGPLHLQIYADGGLKPVDIEKSLANNFNSQELNLDDPSIIDEFIIPILKLIPGIFKEEINDYKKDEVIQLHNVHLKSLGILLQILCHITDWIQSESMQLIPCEEVDNMISNFLLKEILQANLFPFHALGMFTAKIQNLDIVQLNLAVCFLHGRFLLQDENSEDPYILSIFTYIENLFLLPYELQYHAIPMLMKILKIYYCLNNVDEDFSKFVTATVSNMSSLLKSEDDRCNKQVLLSLFIKFSLHPAYEFLRKLESIKQWYIWLLNQLTNIPKSGKVNKNLLQIAKRIANRKHPLFLQALTVINNNDYKAMLKYDNPDVRDSAIFLIYNRKEISTSLFEDISNVILLDTSFPVLYAIRLIRLLTCRYTEKHQNTYKEVDNDVKDADKDADMEVDLNIFKEGRIDFIQFLLNIAVDSLNMTNEKWFDYNANEYTKAIEPFKDVTVYNIFPSLHWKEHSKLFEVCHKSLSLLPRKLVNNVAMLMFKEILGHTRNFPMHCAIAMVKLNNREMKDRHYRIQIDDFIFSTLLTTSILTHISIKDEWYECNVVELMDSMELSRRTALETLQRQLDNMEEMEGIAVYYILRICKFYLERGLFKSEDGERMVNILEGFKEKCADKTFKQQPLFVQLYNIFYFYA